MPVLFSEFFQGMNFEHNIPKTLTFKGILVSVVLLVSASAREIPVTTIDFVEVQNQSLDSNFFRTYIASNHPLTFSAGNTADMILITDLNDPDNLIEIREGEPGDLSDTTDDTFIYIGSYEGFNSQTGQTIDRGYIMIEAQNDAPTFGLSQQEINVGFLRINNPWQILPDQTENFIGGLQGTITYDSLSRSRTDQIFLSGTFQGEPITFSGVASTLVTEDDTVGMTNLLLENADGTAVDFQTILFSRTDNDYEALLRRNNDASEPDRWNHRYAMIVATDTQDSDQDGVPDFSDTGDAVVNQASSVNSIFSAELGASIQDHGNDLYYSDLVGWFMKPTLQEAGSISIFSTAEGLGLMTTNAKDTPYFTRESDGTVLFFQVNENGLPKYYDFATEQWHELNY